MTRPVEYFARQEESIGGDDKDVEGNGLALVPFWGFFEA